MNKPTNKKLIKEYLDYFQHSPQSQAMRKSSLKYFFEKWEIDKEKKLYGYQNHVFDITTKELKKYFTWLKNLDNLSIETKKAKWNILTSFLNSTMEDYNDDFNFAVKIPRKTVNWLGSNGNKTKKKEIVTKNELEQILNYIKPRNLKYYLIFRLFAETGMRKGELINIQYPDINLEKRAIKTKGKRDEKVYYFPKDLTRFLEIYLNNRKNISIKDKTLFIANRFTKYSTRAFNLYLTSICKDLGFKKTITCQTFRRSLNQHRYDMGCSNEDRKILLNQSVRDVNIENYLVLDYKRFIALYDQNNPYKDLNL